MDNSLLRQLYQKYQHEIYLYLYSLCKNKDLAEDLLQEIINQYLDYLNNTFAYDLVKETTKDLAKYMLAMLKYKNKLEEISL